MSGTLPHGHVHPDVQLTPLVLRRQTLLLASVWRVCTWGSQYPAPPHTNFSRIRLRRAGREETFAGERMMSPHALRPLLITDYLIY